MKKYSGFTLIELMITVGIAGIVMAFAIPNMAEFVKNERLTSASNNLLADIMLARSKAVERNQPVIVCASTDLVTCGGSFENGWIVTIDGAIIKKEQATTGDITFSGLAIINFDSRGFRPSGAANATISICDDRSNNYAKTISLSATGRASRGANPACP